MTTIMLLLRELDNCGVPLRKRHKLQRIYISKVSGLVICYNCCQLLCCIVFRDSTSYGILMAMISCLNLDFVSMGVDG